MIKLESCLMGLLTDLIIALPETTPAIVQEYPEHRKWPVLEMKGVDNAALAALASAWGDAKLADILETSKILATRGDNGPWILVVPDSFRDRLAAVKTENIPKLAEVWINQGDMKYGGRNSADAEMLLLSLRDFALTAIEMRKPLLLWMSL